MQGTLSITNPYGFGHFCTLLNGPLWKELYNLSDHIDEKYICLFGRF